MADVSSTLNAWSTTAASNNPAGTVTIGTGLDDNLREIQAVVRQLAASGSIASAATTDLSTVNGTFVTVTGTTTITALGTLTDGMPKVLIFSGALTFTHNATSLILPTSANITTAAGDIAWMLSLGSGNWRCLMFTRADGTAVGGAQFADGSAAAPSITFAADTNTGMYRNGADALAFSANGTQAVLVDTNGVDIAGRLKIGTSDAWAIDADGSFSLTSTANEPVLITIADGASSYFQLSDNSATSRFRLHSQTASDLTTPDELIFAVTGTHPHFGFGRVGNGDSIRLGAALSSGGNNGMHLTVVDAGGGTPTFVSGQGTGSPTIVGTGTAFKVTLGTSPSTTLVVALFYGTQNPPIICCNYQTSNIAVRATTSGSNITFTFASTPDNGGVLDVILFDRQAS